MRTEHSRHATSVASGACLPRRVSVTVGTLWGRPRRCVFSLLIINPLVLSTVNAAGSRKLRGDNLHPRFALEAKASKIAAPAVSRNPSSSRPSGLRAQPQPGPTRDAASDPLDRGGRRFNDAPDEFELVEYPSAEQKHDDPAQERQRKYDIKRAEKRRWLEEQDEMKFSHSIQFNAVPDWSNHYIAYSTLKKL